MTREDLWREVERWRGYDYSDEEIVDCLSHPEKNPHLALLERWTQADLDATIQRLTVE